jgi:hypothetical protein
MSPTALAPSLLTGTGQRRVAGVDVPTTEKMKNLARPGGMFQTTSLEARIRSGYPRFFYLNFVCHPDPLRRNFAGTILPETVSRCACEGTGGYRDGESSQLEGWSVNPVPVLRLLQRTSCPAAIVLTFGRNGCPTLRGCYGVAFSSLSSDIKSIGFTR